MSVKAGEEPRNCLAFIPDKSPGHRIGHVSLGMDGYYRTMWDRVDFTDEQARALVDEYNTRLGVTPERSAYLLNGALNGWEN